MTGGDALAGVVVGAVPGCPGGVRALADSWRLTGRALVEGADLAASARAATASWQGAAARAFTAAATALTGDLDDGAERLEAGARALEGYARVLDRAVVAADQLRAALAPVLAAAQAAPATAPVAVAVIARTAGAWTNILAEVRLAALRTATTLQAAADDNNPQAGGGADNSGGGKDDEGSHTDDRTPFFQPDIDALREQADGSGGWDLDANQTLIGDCFLLAALQAYSQTPEGQQHLRDHVRWDEDKQAFVVTLYDHGRPVDVEVRDTYTNGNRGQTSMIDIYERAYGIHFGDDELANGGVPEEDALEVISSGDAHTLSTWGGSGWFRWPRKEDHQYTDAQWDEIQQAVQDSRPVVGLTGRGDFSHGDAATATTDTNRSGTVGDGPDQTPIKETDQEGTYRIVGSDYDHDPTTPESGHQYTIVAVDDEGVTLRNPWGHNDIPKGFSSPPAGHDGLIRISRADYEKYFSHTTIGEAP